MAVEMKHHGLPVELHDAIKNHMNILTIERLMCKAQQDIPLRTQDFNQRSLICACYYGFTKLVDYILQKCVSGATKFLRSLRKKRKRDGHFVAYICYDRDLINGLLLMALYLKHSEIANLLLQKNLKFDGVLNDMRFLRRYVDISSTENTPSGKLRLLSFMNSCSPLGIVLARDDAEQFRYFVTDAVFDNLSLQGSQQLLRKVCAWGATECLRVIFERCSPVCVKESISRASLGRYGGTYPFLLACKSSLDTTQAIFEYFENPNSCETVWDVIKHCDGEHRNALHYALQCGTNGSTEVFSTGLYDVNTNKLVQLLLSKGIDDSALIWEQRMPMPLLAEVCGIKRHRLSYISIVLKQLVSFSKMYTDYKKIIVLPEQREYFPVYSQSALNVLEEFRYLWAKLKALGNFTDRGQLQIDGMVIEHPLDTWKEAVHQLLKSFCKVGYNCFRMLLRSGFEQKNNGLHLALEFMRKLLTFPEISFKESQTYKGNVNRIGWILQLSMCVLTTMRIKAKKRFKAGEESIQEFISAIHKIILLHIQNGLQPNYTDINEVKSMYSRGHTDEFVHVFFSMLYAMSQRDYYAVIESSLMHPGHFHLSSDSSPDTDSDVVQSVHGDNTDSGSDSDWDFEPPFFRKSLTGSGAGSESSDESNDDSSDESSDEEARARPHSGTRRHRRIHASNDHQQSVTRQDDTSLMLVLRQKYGCIRSLQDLSRLSVYLTMVNLGHNYATCVCSLKLPTTVTDYLLNFKH